MPKALTSGDNRVKKLCRWFVEFCDSWFVKQIAKPIIFLLPPTIVATAATREGLKQEVFSLFGNYIGDYLNTSALILLVGAYLYIVVVKALYAAIHSYSKPARELQIDDLLAVLRAIHIVVSDKCQRMSLSAQKALEQQSVDPAHTFLGITRPDQQIPLLMRGVISVFDYIDDNEVSFRGGLMRVVNERPSEWFAFEPIDRPPMTPIEDLSDATSTISRCIKRKRLVVVDDIQKELKNPAKKRNYVQGSSQPNDQGSQLCYPIVHSATRKVEYVLCLSGDKAGCLLGKYSDLYNWILGHFAIRISMEHSLLILKEKANAETLVTA